VGVDVLGPRVELDPVRERLASAGAVEVGADAWEAFRIDRGIPRQPADIDDSTIPQEAELELDAVSFTKGCFLGQELVCRIDARGHVNRFLRRLRDIDGAIPEVGSELIAAGKVVGAVTSVTPSGFTPVALGYVRREVEPGAAVEVRSSTGTARARVVPLHSEA
jgi:folate-binding protein YgfZ